MCEYHTGGYTVAEISYTQNASNSLVLYQKQKDSQMTNSNSHHKNSAQPKPKLLVRFSSHLFGDVPEIIYEFIVKNN